MEVAFIRSSTILPFQNCCLSRIFVQVSYKQLRPYKDWGGREQKTWTFSFYSLIIDKGFPSFESIFSSLPSIFNSFSVPLFFFFFLFFSRENQIIRQIGKSRTLPLSNSFPICVLWVWIVNFTVLPTVLICLYVIRCSQR